MKYDALIHLLSYGGRKCDSLAVSGWCSRQELQNGGGGRDRLSFTPPLSLQGKIVMGGPHSLLAMYASVEKQISDHDWYQGKTAKANTLWIFQITEIS